MYLIDIPKYEYLFGWFRSLSKEERKIAKKLFKEYKLKNS